MKKNNNGIGIIVRLFGREFKVDLSFSSNIITNNTQPKTVNKNFSKGVDKKIFGKVKNFKNCNNFDNMVSTVETTLKKLPNNVFNDIKGLFDNINNLSNEDRQSKKNLMSEKDSQNALSDIENEIDEIDKNVIGHLSSDIGRVLNNAEIVESNPNDKGIPIEVDNNNK